jgi:endonuclease/exonuclease/phosphatase family metal-dependent hydrolase
MLDHCIINDKLKNRLHDALIVDNVENWSDHLPLVVKFKVESKHCMQGVNKVVSKAR